MSSTRTLRRTAPCMALAVPTAFAGNTDGWMLSHTQINAVVTGTNPATDLTRTVTADDMGNYRFPFLRIDFPAPRHTQLSRSADF